MKKPYAQKTTSPTASSREHITQEGHERKNSHDVKKKEEIIMKNTNMLQPNFFNETNEQGEAVMESDLILTDPEMNMLDASQEEGLTPAETGKFVSDVASTLWIALEMSEKNALDVTTAVNQVERMSYSEQYKKAIDAIFSDQTLNMEEKLRLKAEEDARQDVKDERATDRVIKIQSSQKNTIIETLKAYAGIIAWGVGGVSVLLLCGTTTGRAVLTKAVPWAIRKVPHLARQVAV